MPERQSTLNASEIKQMMDNTRNLQNKAAQTLESAISGRIPVFDPRSSDAQEENTGAAVIWSTKSIELAYKALKDGYSLRKSPFFRGNISLRKANLNFQYTQEELEEIIKCKNDIIYFANTYCYLKTESGKRHIVLRPYQEKLLRNYQNNRFNITLASRQIGKTTTTAIFAAWYTCFNIDKTFGIVAQRETTASEVFAKVKSIVEYLPFFLKPGTYNFSTTSYSFDNGCQAVYRVASIDCLQGGTIDCLYVDEFAYIRNTKAREFWVNVYPTISSMKNSKIFITSTPNGKNLFFELWQGALEHKNTFVPFRVDYWQVPGHDAAWVAQEKANIGEEGFAQQYGLSFDTKMKALLTIDTFHYLQKIEQKFEPNLLPIGTDFDECFRWSTQFSYSLKNDWFLLSIDIGEGLGKDSSVIKIKKLVRISDKTTIDSGLPQTHFKLVTVGIFESNTIQIPDFAKVFVQLCRRLNLDQTRIIVERNTYGDLFMVHVDNICEHTNDGFEIPVESYAKFKRNETAKFEKGIRVNSSNKKIGVAAYQEYMNKKFDIETDDQSIAQIREFGDDGNGNFKAAVGHDDLVMPEVNMAYYIKSNNQGWREFLSEFAESVKIDAYNYLIITKIDTNAIASIKRDTLIDNADIVDEPINEYDDVAPDSTDKSNEYALIDSIAKSKIAAKAKQLFEEVIDSINKNEYELAFKDIKSKQAQPTELDKIRALQDSSHRGSPLSNAIRNGSNSKSKKIDPTSLIDLA